MKLTKLMIWTVLTVCISVVCADDIGGPGKILKQSPTGTWTLLPCTGQPDGRHETTFVACQGKFYLIGGRESRKIDRFDPLTKMWTKMQATSPLILHFQPVLWNDKIYMVGGICLGHTSGTNNWFDAYDPATNTWQILPDAPHKRDHFHAVVLNDKLYCLGGRDTSYHEPGNVAAFFGAVIREVDSYDFKSGTWSTLKAKLPVGSAAAGVAVLNGKILYFGGETAKKGPVMSRTWALDPQTETWTELAPMNQGRHGSQAVVYDNKVYIAAGSPVRGGGRINTIEMFSF